MTTSHKNNLAEQRLQEALDQMVVIIDHIERKKEFTDAYITLDPDIIDGRNFRQVVFDSLLDVYIDATIMLDQKDVPLAPYRLLMTMRDQKTVQFRAAKHDFERERERQHKDDYPFAEPECLSIFGNKPRIELLDLMPAWKTVASALADTLQSDPALRAGHRMERLMSRVTLQFDKRYERHEDLLREKKDARTGDYNNDELNMLVMRAEDKEVPPAAMKHLRAKLKELDGLQQGSNEYGSLLRPLNALVALPWNRRAKLINDINETETRLDEKHFGLDKVKEIIAEHVAVQQRTENGNGTVLCLNGAPGIGKTSLAEAISYATGRPLVRIALGGVRDVVDIRGHSSAYTGAKSGRIISALIKVGVKNPIFLLDEADKVGTGNGDNRDVESALLEVIDPEQNQYFHDSFIDVPFDLSEVMFIATSNDKFDIMLALRNRMEVVDLPSYTAAQKLQIAQRYLLPKQMKKAGLADDDLDIQDDTLKLMIDQYVREPGVRELDRLIGKLCRKAAYKLQSGTSGMTIQIGAAPLQTYLGKPKVSTDILTRKDSVGIANGLGVAGGFGSIIPFEVIKMKSKGEFKITRTGQMKNVMQESIDIVTSWIRANPEKCNMDDKKLKNIELHVDAVTDGGKDGPSAGIALLSACVSALRDQPLPAHFAMTGKLTLGGRIRAIGGTIEKLEGAMREGLTTVLIPMANMRDLSDASEEIKSKLRIIKVETADDVLSAIFSENIKLLSYQQDTPKAAATNTGRQVPAVLTAPGPR